VIVPHRLEWAFQHRVLEIRKRFHCGDFACELKTKTEVTGPPGYTLSQPDQAGSYPAGCYRLLPEMDIAGKMHFNAASQVETAADGSIDKGRFLNSNQNRSVVGRMLIVKRTVSTPAKLTASVFRLPGFRVRWLPCRKMFGRPSIYHGA